MSLMQDLDQHVLITSLIIKLGLHIYLTYNYVNNIKPIGLHAKGLILDYAGKCVVVMIITIAM